MDIAEVNLIYASGLPGSLQPEVRRCLRWVDEAARFVSSETERHTYTQHSVNPATQQGKCRFRLGPRKNAETSAPDTTLSHFPCCVELFSLTQLLRNFIVFETVRGQIIRKLARYPQFVAANEAVERVRTAKRAARWGHLAHAGFRQVADDAVHVRETPPTGGGGEPDPGCRHRLHRTAMTGSAWSAAGRRSRPDRRAHSLQWRGAVAPRPSIFSPEFEARVSALQSEEAQASEMEHAIHHEIHVRLDENPVFYGSLRQRLEEIIEDRRRARIDTAAQLRMFHNMAGEIRNVRQALDPLPPLDARL